MDEQVERLVLNQEVSCHPTIHRGSDNPAFSGFESVLTRVDWLLRIGKVDRKDSGQEPYLGVVRDGPAGTEVDAVEGQGKQTRRR